jgi:hypothetical protein
MGWIGVGITGWIGKDLMGWIGVAYAPFGHLPKRVDADGIF